MYMDEISKPLFDYYLQKRDLIERSIETIIPPECTFESMNQVVGKVDLKWDFRTLQKTFFNPAYEYLHKRKENIIGLSTCLFLEAAGMELDKLIPLLSFPVFLETSNEIFKDITDWTTMDNAKSAGMSSLEISIKGNVSIALLTLPMNNLIFHRLDLNTERSLKLYESLTTNIFNSLFGNGIKLYWERLKKLPINLEEYYEAASLLNQGYLRFGGDLLLMFHEKQYDDVAISALGNFIEKRSLAIQMERDILSFERIKADLNITRNDHFNWYSNFLFIHTAKKLNNASIKFNDLSQQSIIDLIHKSDSAHYAYQKINELKEISNKELGKFPIEETYKELLKYYCDYLVFR
jgi:hypothetical protein